MKKVLLVEDAAEIVLLAEALLGTLDGVQVVTARDGDAGLAQALLLAPDLVLLDLTLPGLSGREVLAGLRADERTREATVVLFTGATDLDEALGADAVLHKPFTPDALLDCVSRLLDLRLAS